MYTNDNTIFSLLEMPQPEIPPNPEDEPLSTDLLIGLQF